MKKFSGPRVTTGCALFIIIIMSGSGLYSAGYSKLAETFHTSMSHLGFYSMLLTISGIICSVSLTSLKQKITLKGVLTLDALVLYAVALCAKLLGDQLLTLLVFFISVGITLSLGAHVVMTELSHLGYQVRRIGRYRKAGYSKKYYDAHESDILIHKAAKKAFDELALKKLPTVKSLQAEYSDLLVQKKLDYAALAKAREEARQLQIYKANAEMLLRTDADEQRQAREHQQEK